MGKRKQREETPISSTSTSGSEESEYSSPERKRRHRSDKKRRREKEKRRDSDERRRRRRKIKEREERDRKTSRRKSRKREDSDSDSDSEDLKVSRVGPEDVVGEMLKEFPNVGNDLTQFVTLVSEPYMEEWLKRLENQISTLSQQMNARFEAMWDRMDQHFHENDLKWDQLLAKIREVSASRHSPEYGEIHVEDKKSILGATTRVPIKLATLGAMVVPTIGESDNTEKKPIHVNLREVIDDDGYFIGTDIFINGAIMDGNRVAFDLEKVNDANFDKTNKLGEGGIDVVHNMNYPTFLVDTNEKLEGIPVILKVGEIFNSIIPDPSLFSALVQSNLTGWKPVAKFFFHMENLSPFDSYD